MISRRMSLAVCLAVAAALPAVAGCGPKSSPAAASGTASPDASASMHLGTASPTPGQTPAQTATPVLPDGRSPVYLTGIDASKKTITFDLIEFLTGDAAKQAWKKANPGSSEDGPDDDYFIVNDNPKLRTLPVTGTVQVNVLQSGGGSPDPMAISFAALPGYLTAAGKPDDKRLSYNPFWLTVLNGQIVKVDEQFIP